VFPRLPRTSSLVRRLSALCSEPISDCGERMPAPCDSSGGELLSLLAVFVFVWRSARESETPLVEVRDGCFTDSRPLCPTSACSVPPGGVCGMRGRVVAPSVCTADAPVLAAANVAPTFLRCSRACDEAARGPWMLVRLGEGSNLVVSRACRRASRLSSSCTNWLIRPSVLVAFRAACSIGSSACFLASDFSTPAAVVFADLTATSVVPSKSSRVFVLFSRRSTAGCGGVIARRW
jgi:hypothetical protein